MKANITPKEIAQRLADQCEHVCRWLLPNGKAMSGEWCVGSVAGEAGQSCKIRLTGERVGVWSDFASDASGDLLDLIQHVKACNIRQAIMDAKVFLGLKEPENVIPAKKYQKPRKTPPRPQSVTDCPIVEYLTGSRKLPRDTVDKFGVYGAGRDIVFPSISPEGELVSVKYIGLDRTEDGKKKIRQEAGCPPALFGWPTIPDGCREVVITEGQIDAMTWASFRLPALSVPNGTGDNEGWIEYEWDNLQRFDSIYLSFDGDKPGRDAVEKVSRRLGLHRCLNVILPDHKDANEALQAGKGEGYFLSAMAAAKPFKPDEIVTPSEMRESVLNELFPRDGILPGFWPETVGKKVGFRDGELTLWTGINGHGKTALLLQVAMEASAVGMRVAIASMETPAKKTLATAVKLAYPQGWKISDMSEQHAVEILHSLSGFLWVFNVLGSIKQAKLFELMEYAVARFGVRFFIVDSLMKLDVGVDDYQAQADAISRLKDFAVANSVHVHLVCHSRKLQGESDAPGKMDIKGGGEISNHADNILSVWRNKAKEEKRSANTLTDQENNDVPDSMVYLVKDREFGEECSVGLWFNKSRRRFMPRGTPTMRGQVAPFVYPKLSRITPV
jgi:twinkle protein